MKTIIATIISGTVVALAVLAVKPALADGPVYEPIPLPELTEPVIENNWTGPYVGVHAGMALTSTTSTLTDERDVTEDQCWKYYKGQYIKELDMSEGYCGDGGPNDHYNDHAVLLEDVVIGTEVFEYDVTEQNQYTGYGLHAGYLYDFGTLVVGVEGDYTFYEDTADTIAAKARAGFDMGSIMPYGVVGYEWSDLGDGMIYGGGVDLRVTNSIILGVEYLTRENGDESVMARVSYQF